MKFNALSNVGAGHCCEQTMTLIIPVLVFFHVGLQPLKKIFKYEFSAFSNA